MKRLERNFVHWNRKNRNRIPRKLKSERSLSLTLIVFAADLFGSTEGYGGYVVIAGLLHIPYNAFAYAVFGNKLESLEFFVQPQRGIQIYELTFISRGLRGNIEMLDKQIVGGNAV